MNWGFKIFAAFLAFAVFLGVLIYRTYQSKVHLVAPDYYQQELAFQDQIDKLENEKALKFSVSIEHDDRLRQLLISFPSNLEIKSAEVALYRPSDAGMDRQWKLQLGENNSQSLSTENLASGLWQVKLEWQDGSKAYLKELNLYLP